MDGTQSRQSTKVAFLTKVNSCIADYGLLHDLWIVKTVSEAISCRCQWLCSPAQSLETKPFSAEYWKWQHRFLLDAVARYGPPSVFVMISPYEWTFPIPPWLALLRHITGREPIELAGFETYHITHVLEQVIRGYLCGSNDKRWTNQVFNYNRVRGCHNVQTYFYHFEFQGQGTDEENIAWCYLGFQNCYTCMISKKKA